ncbi:MAG: hypothetical protein DI551_00610 [Micavibrio aeruginosavorus]|uniref:Uncharacterized protein n=1 Tax=Micavibrio aeruginosavorus TaxID=349221 RepID=A0A2W5NDQ1_9BACT|nr:MAG: hypothetical protein DI551_00610 [Micavibrio aeruginosavorus]
MTNILNFPDRMKAIAAQTEMKKPAVIELYWVKNNEACVMSCSDPQRIYRQMESLAERKIPAAAYENGWPVGYVGPGPNTRAGGRFQAFYYLNA